MKASREAEVVVRLRLEEDARVCSVMSSAWSWSGSLYGSPCVCLSRRATRCERTCGSQVYRRTEARGWARSTIEKPRPSGGYGRRSEGSEARENLKHAVWGSKCVRPRPRPAVATRAASRRRGPTKGARNPTEGDDGGARLNLPRSAAVAITSGMDEVIGRGSTVTSPMGGAVGQPFWLRPTSL